MILPENTVHIRREQLLASEIFFDRMTFENFNLTPVDFTVEVLLDADFVDVFQVRGVARQKHGQYYKPIVKDSGIAFYYRGLDGVMRETLIKVSPKPTEIKERTVRWELRLEPLKRVELDLNITPLVEGRKSRAQIYEMDQQLRQRRANFARWEISLHKLSDGQRCPRRAAQDRQSATSMPCRFPTVTSTSLLPAFRGSPQSSAATPSLRRISRCS